MQETYLQMTSAPVANLRLTLYFTLGIVHAFTNPRWSVYSLTQGYRQVHTAGGYDYRSILPISSSQSGRKNIRFGAVFSKHRTQHRTHLLPTFILLKQCFKVQQEIVLQSNPFILLKLFRFLEARPFLEQTGSI